jgi:sodium-dependent dicarboxylate transporter 2/3/5
MWVNNSATTVMMLPIALAAISAIVPKLDAPETDGHRRNFAAAMILGISLASNIGGFATPIGTPVNSIAVGILERSFDTSISFAQWMSFGVPGSLPGYLAVPIRWWLA